MRSGRFSVRRPAVLVLALLLTASLVGCSMGAPPHSPSGRAAGISGITVSGLPATFHASIAPDPAGSAVAVSSTRPGSPLAADASGAFTLTPSGPLPQPATVTVPLTHPAAQGLVTVVATRESPDQPWTYLPAQLTPDRTEVLFRTTHFSIFDVVLVDLNALFAEFKKDVVDSLTGGLTVQAAPPTCENEQGARAGGFHITSGSADTVYWCFGYDQADAGTTRVLKVVNTRRYPLLVHRDNMAVVKNDYDWAQLANLSRLSGTIIAPHGTAIFNADLDPGGLEGVRTEIDGLGEGLFALQTGVESLLTILTRFGLGSGTKSIDLIEKLVAAPGCAQALTQGPGAVITKCLDAKDIFEVFGTAAGVILAPLATISGVVEFFASDVTAIGDTILQRDQYRIVVTRDEPTFGPFVGSWGGHTRSLEVNADGTVHESVGDGCCNPIFDAWYRLSNPRQSGTSWLADALVTKVALHDPTAADLAPRLGQTRTIRVDGHGHLYDPSDIIYCDNTPATMYDCGA